MKKTIQPLAFLTLLCSLWDYGLAGVFADGEGFPVPWFSFTLEF